MRPRPKARDEGGKSGVVNLRLLVAAIVLFALLTGAAAAQTPLIVNGVEITDVRSDLVPGVSYAAAEPFAESFGARFRHDPTRSRASFELGGRVATIDVFDSAREAADAGESIRVDGRVQGGPGAVLADGSVYVPVRQVARVFYGNVSHVPERGVIVVFDRATLTEVTMPEGRDTEYERIVVEVSRPAPVYVSADDDSPVVRFRFDRTDSRTAYEFEGEHFSLAELAASRGRVELELHLNEDARYDWWQIPAGRGFQLVVDVFPEERAESRPARRGALIVIDPARGGADGGIEFGGLGRESELTLSFSALVAERLRDRGLRVELTRDDDSTVSKAERASAGAAADVFLSVHGVDASAGSATVYYLGDAGSSELLASVIRRNAEQIADARNTDSLRREILLGFVPELQRGEDYAEMLIRELSREANLRVRAEAAPLTVLAGAAGRGLLIELSPDDLDSEDVAAALARALESMLEMTH